MGRRTKTSPAEDFVTVVALMPWWAAMLIALINYLGLHAYATQPVVVSVVPGQVATSMLPAIFKGLASVGQYILPILCVIAAVISWVKKSNVQKGKAITESPKGNAVPEVTKTTPVCPVCSGAMLLRTAKRGTNAGASFWGCTNYPDCKGTRSTT